MAGNPPAEVPLLAHDGTCDACEPDEAGEAVEICDDCELSFCGLHVGEHRSRHAGHRVRGFSPQPAAAAGAKGPGPESQVSDKKMCATHNQELTLYCKEDKKIICVLCAVTGVHKGHELITLQDAYKAMKNRRPVDLKQAMSGMVERLKDKCSSHKVSRGEIKGFIQQEFDHMRQLVLEEEQRALHYVDLQEAMASANVTEVLEKLNVHMGKLMSEMAEITQQLNSFNQVAMQKPENPEEESREDKPPLTPQHLDASAHDMKAPCHDNPRERMLALCRYLHHFQLLLLSSALFSQPLLWSYRHRRVS
ncbi:tripartite motif-containing protein 44 isoform X1 [Ascaphus truei]|uniref:tripartite motif-containing protein 44 isoform X1 n=1 Tax=Ascaphus truei TaxID=8439 RepID=UPI003F59D393